MRLPVEMLEQHLGAILEGILLWSEDSKNKFRLKVHSLSVPLARATYIQARTSVRGSRSKPNESQKSQT